MTETKASDFVVRYLQLTAVITALIGLVLLCWPERILQWFIPGATGDFFVRFIGSALMGYAALNWLSAKLEDYVLRRVALLANLVTLSIATGLSIVGTVGGAIESNAWLLIGEHILFVTGFIYAFRVNRKTPH